MPLLRHCKHNLSIFKTWKEGLPSLIKRKKSSQEWMNRQLKDPYVEKAKIQNYRCRSAFKLLEMDDRYHFLAPGHTVVDCGAAPGSWTQVAVERCNAHGNDKSQPVGCVVAMDLLQIYPVSGAITLSNMDFTSSYAQEKLGCELKNQEVDVFLSDMAPNASGVQTLDHDKIVVLVVSALRFALQASKPGATFLAKIWDGQNKSKLSKELERFYSSVKIVKPPASRSDSAELFLLARDFKGLKR